MFAQQALRHGKMRSLPWVLRTIARGLVAENLKT